MKLGRRDWPSRGWLYDFHKLIDWGRMVGKHNKPFAQFVGPKPTPEIIAVAEPVVVVPTRLRKPQKVTEQIGFGF